MYFGLNSPLRHSCVCPGQSAVASGGALIVAQVQVCDLGFCRFRSVGAEESPPSGAAAKGQVNGVMLTGCVALANGLQTSDRIAVGVSGSLQPQPPSRQRR